MTTRRFELLIELYGDQETIEIFSETSLVQTWLDIEASLASAQAELGVLDDATALAISKAARIENIDLGALWTDARNVGYPILPLVRQLDALLPKEHQGHVHLGATTQDIMDTGLGMQMKAAAMRQDQLLEQFGDSLASLVRQHQSTIMVARTHGQHAVPTVLGMKLAVYLTELSRHRTRLLSASADISVLSLFGAGGTSAAFGGVPAELRQKVADKLGLYSTDVPRHVARDTMALFTSVNAALAATCSRFAREVIDLSRTEIGEMKEADGYLRGASSTMPQKSNPIDSEGIVGLAACAASLNSAMLRAMEAGHERAAGEWQIEWQALPEILILCSSALGTAARIAEGLRVFPERMEENLRGHGGEVMAEAYMMLLAPELGREVAHEVVYEAVRKSRKTQIPLFNALSELCPPLVRTHLREIQPEDYLGDSALVISMALKSWESSSDPLRVEALLD